MSSDLLQAACLIGAIATLSAAAALIAWLTPRRDRYSPRPGRIDTGPRPLPDPKRRRR